MGEKERSGERPPDRPAHATDTTGDQNGQESVTDEQSATQASAVTPQSDDGRPPPASDDDDSPGPAASVGIALLGIALVLVLVGANGAIATDQTVLDADHVVETFEREGIFASFTEQFREDVTTQLSNATATTTPPPGVDTTGVNAAATAEASVSEGYVREEMSENIRILYAFLHGEREDAPFVLDLRPVKESVTEELSGSIAIDTPTLVATTSDNISRDRVAALEADQQQFEDARREMTDEQAERLKADIETQTRQEGYSENVTRALVALQFTVVDGLAGELDFEAYNEQRRQNERGLAAALAADAVADIDDERDLNDGGSDPSETSSRAVTTTQQVTTLTWLLPLVAVVLVGLVAVLSRSFDRTAATTGWALLTAGVVSVLFGLVLGDLVVGTVRDTILGGGSTNPFLDGFVAVLETLVRLVGVQGGVLVLAGLVVVGVVMADRRGSLADLSQRIGVADRTETPAQSDDPAQPETGGGHADHSQPPQDHTGQPPDGNQHDRE